MIQRSVHQLVTAREEMLASTGSGPKIDKMRFYSGAALHRFDDLSGRESKLRFELTPQAADFSRMAGAPLLKDHTRRTEAVVGVIERAWIDGSGAYAEYRLSTTSDVDVIRRKIATKIITQVEMQAYVNELRETTPRGASLREYVAVRWQPVALALTPVSSDPQAMLLSEQDASSVWLAQTIWQHPSMVVTRLLQMRRRLMER